MNLRLTLEQLTEWHDAALRLEEDKGKPGDIATFESYNTMANILQLLRPIIRGNSTPPAE